MIRVLFIALAIGVTLYALFDWLLNSKTRTPGGISRWIWLAVILLLPVLGPLTWIIMNWISAAEGRMDGYQPPARKQPQAPDDDRDFLDDISRRIERQQRHGRKDQKPQPPTEDGEGDEDDQEGGS